MSADAVAAERDALGSELMCVRAALDASLHDLSSLRPKVSVMKARLLTFESERDSAVAEALQLRLAHSDLEEQCLEAQAAVSALQATLASDKISATSAHDMLSAECHELRIALEAASRQLATATSSAEAVNLARHETQAELCACRKSEESLRFANELLQGEITEARTKCSKLKSELAEQDSATSELRASHAALKNDLDEAWRIIDDLRLQVSSLRGRDARSVLDAIDGSRRHGTGHALQIASLCGDATSTRASVSRVPVSLSSPVIDSSALRFEAVKELISSFISLQRSSGCWSGHASTKSRDTLSILARSELSRSSLLTMRFSCRNTLLPCLCSARPLSV